MILIVDCGFGNLGSIRNMLKQVSSTQSIISSSPKDIHRAQKIILPGVGTFDRAMRSLQEKGLLSVLQSSVVVEKKMYLGICLGMQILFEKSEEGEVPGLGWIEGEVVRFNFREEHPNLKIPHMGWDQVHQVKKSGILSQMYSEGRFYFAHSYHAICARKEDILLTTEYGYEFVSGVQKGNIYGMQFHPEKSHKYGKKIFENFCDL